ncbi:MAG: GNAT family N-acetyltransferase [Actinomycetota bacterium]|nr:GNAT family N-acetyltransferase [Actinomycetota bacterium]
MDPLAARAAYDQHLRRNPTASPGEVVERDARVVRIMWEGGWAGVLWSDLGGLSPDEVDAAVAAEVARFGPRGTPWEWKWHAYDEPVDLPDRLIAAGLTRGEDEALMVAELVDLDLDVPPPEGVRLEPVTDAGGVARLVAVHDAVFGGDHSGIGRHVASGITGDPPTCAAVVAMAGDEPISSGRVELHHGTPFASIWGGGTVPAWRGRGVFRALVAQRAAVAAEHGFRYLQVDASPESRPILQRLGFVQLAVTVPFAGGE